MAGRVAPTGPRHVKFLARRQRPARDEQPQACAHRLLQGPLLGARRLGEETGAIDQIPCAELPSVAQFAIITAMTTLWIIRHGETDWNVEGRLQGQAEVPLNAKGREQAQQLAARLAREHAAVPFAALFTSDLGRARETASAAKLGLPMLERAALRERHFGVLSELTLPEAEVRHPELFARWRVRDPDFIPEGGESLAQMYLRSVQALSEIAGAWPDQQVIVVTHGGVLDSAWRKAKGLPLHVKRDHELFNASINRVRVKDDQFEVAGWGDVAHLSG